MLCRWLLYFKHTFSIFLSWFTSCFLISSISRRTLKLSVTISRTLVNTLIIWIFTDIARSLCNAPDNISTPCSKKAFGSFRRPPQLDVPNWNIKLSNSSFVTWSIKSSGKRAAFRLTALFRFPVVHLLSKFRG